ncbi:Pentatricopeptide repeat-containing protein [Seminavis robusta]|uniref:Pentatricopeptide repeat-containing protein n=1 Tax=Seminavis robusta TaxID=568900 RepID=A0A9N8DDA8_9STRA|nr:Pentatricopeptide repeat-containing protein [Seminavis robusta]|eukprot:Sro71_g039250.1 Pentatricopeptide repeat-containing protein (739) ;mRNA; f:17109-19664
MTRYCGFPKRRDVCLLTVALLIPSLQAFQVPAHCHWPNGRIPIQQRVRGLYQSLQQEQQDSATSVGVVLKKENPTLDDKNNKRLVEQSIVQLGRKGLTDEALAVYYEQPAPTLRIMNGAIDACARARPTRLDKAFQILQEQETRLRPNVFTFGALMSACARARKGDKARALLKSMQEKYGVIPNAVVYSTAIAAVARNDPPQPQVALALLKEATEKHNLIMNIVGYNAAISACARAGDWKRATALLEQLEDDNNNNGAQPDHVTYGTVLSACEKGEKWDLVLEYADQMEAKGLTLDVLALTSALKACQQLAKAKQALHYLDVMKQQQQKATSTSYYFTRKTSGRKRKGAKQALLGPDPVAYRLAISACARGGAWKEGIGLLNDFEEATGQPPDVMAYTAAITGCEYAGEWRRAFGLLDVMRKNGVEPNEVTMTAIIGACAVACARETNSVTFRDSTPMPLPQHKALQLLKVLKNDDTVVKPNINVYNAAIRVCAEACDLKRALLLMKDLREQGLEPTIVTFGTLMTASERAESIDGANIVFRTMKEQQIEPNEIIYGAAISCCRKARQSERAFLLLRKMIRDGLSPNVATFNTAIVAQVEGRPVEKCMDRAITIYKIMTSKNHTMARPNRGTFNLLIRGLASAKKPLEAEALLRKMGEAGYVQEVELYAATVTAYERNGQPLKALRLMESMREDGYDFYDIEVLNAAFKKAVKLVNVVGRGLSPDCIGLMVATVEVMA